METLLSIGALFSGVFGAVIGFIIIGATAVLLALPYVLMNRQSDGPNEREITDERY